MVRADAKGGIGRIKEKEIEKRIESAKPGTRRKQRRSKNPESEKNRLRENNEGK